MPWQEKSIMSERMEFVNLAIQEGANIQQLCERFGISRKTGYKLLGRYREEGLAGLADRSRRPHTSPHQTAPEIEAAVLAVRDAHPAWGGRKIKAWLARQGTPAPSASTITEILRRNGQLDAEERRKHRPLQRFVQAAPNDLWQLDFKGDLRLVGRTVYPLSILDDHSRFALGLFACANRQQPTVQAHLTRLFQRYGLPRRILADNGPPWGSSGREGLTALEAWLMRLGIGISHGRFYHPQTQGKVERFHRTLQAELLAGPPLLDLSACQTALDSWRELYNLERPHQALELGVPVELYQVSPRLFPKTLPEISYGPDDQVRKVRGQGTISFGNRIHFVGRGVIGLPVAVRPTRIDGRFTVHFCTQQIRTIDLRQDETGL